MTRDVAAPADDVWTLLRDFGNVGWIPGPTRVDVEGDGPGMRRLIHGSGDGPPVVERLISVDDAGRTIEYAIDENNPLPVDEYRGTVTIDDAPGGARIRWSAAFEPSGDEAEARNVIELMLGALAGWLAEATAK